MYIHVHSYPPPSPQGDPLWSARLLHTHPAVIAEIHRSYLEHGADIITTASYQVSWRRHTLVVELGCLLRETVFTVREERGREEMKGKGELRIGAIYEAYFSRPVLMDSANI